MLLPRTRLTSAQAPLEVNGLAIKSKGAEAHEAAAHQVDLSAGVAFGARALIHAPVLCVKLVIRQQRHLAKALLRCARPAAW